MDIKVGDRCAVAIHGHGGVARVMAVAEGYAMVRYLRATPFVGALKELSKID